MTHEGTSWLEVELQAGSSIWYPVTFFTPRPPAGSPQRPTAPAARAAARPSQAAAREARIVRCWPDGAREVLGATA